MPIRSSPNEDARPYLSNQHSSCLVEMDFLVGLFHISIIIIFNSGFIFLAYDNACENSLAYAPKAILVNLFM